MSRSKGAIVETSRLVEKSLSLNKGEALKNPEKRGEDLLLNPLAFASVLQAQRD